MKFVSTADAFHEKAPRPPVNVRLGDGRLVGWSVGRLVGWSVGRIGWKSGVVGSDVEHTKSPEG